MEKEKNPRSYVLWLLTGRDYSRGQLEKKLKARGVEPAEIRTLLEGLIEEGLFREQNYQRARTRQLLRKGLGAPIVKSKLRAEKCQVSDDDIARGFEELGVDPQAQLRAAVEKELRRWARRTGADPREYRQRIARSLALKGHRIGDVLRLVDALVKGDGNG